LKERALTAATTACPIAVHLFFHCEGCFSYTDKKWISLFRKILYLFKEAKKEEKQVGYLPEILSIVEVHPPQHHEKLERRKDTY